MSGSVSSKGSTSSKSSMMKGQSSMTIDVPGSSKRNKKRSSAVKVELKEKNRLGVTPPKRINVANGAVADELLASQNLLFLQQEDYYKAQEHIQLLSGEVDNLKVVVKKKQDLINRLQQGITDRDYKIDHLKKEVHDTHIERSAFKILEDQNVSLISKVTETGTKLENTQGELRGKIEEHRGIRNYSDAKVADAIKTEVMLQSTIQQITFNLNIADKEKFIAQEEQKKLQKQMLELSQHLQLMTETSKEQLYRSRQTEYNTLKRLDEVTNQYVTERDEKEQLRSTVQMASMRGDVLSNRLSDALDKTEEQQLMVQSIVRQVENSNDALRGREKILEKQNMHLTAQLKVSQMAVADMLRRYKIAEKEIEQNKIDYYDLKQKSKPKKKGEIRDSDGNALDPVTGKILPKKKPPGMSGSTTANANKMYMEKLAQYTSESLQQTFPREPHLADTVSSSILSEGGGGEGRSIGGFKPTNGSFGGSVDVGDALSDYNSFIVDMDQRSVGSNKSNSTFGTNFEHKSSGNDSYSNNNGNGNLSGGKAIYDNIGSLGQGSVVSGGEAVPSLSGGMSIYGLGSSVAPSFQGSVVAGGGGMNMNMNTTPLPTLLADQEAQAMGKSNLLAAYLRLMISAQNNNGAIIAIADTTNTNKSKLPQLATYSAGGLTTRDNGNIATSTGSGSASSLQTIDLVKCELYDKDMIQIVDLLRLINIKEINKIDLRHNHFTSKSIDSFTAFIIGLATVDLIRINKPLEIDLRYNHLSTKAIENIGLKIRMSPRQEIKLVQFDDGSGTGTGISGKVTKGTGKGNGNGDSNSNSTMILVYGVNKILIKIDCRNNDETNIPCGASGGIINNKIKKQTLKERLHLGSCVTNNLEIAYPGDDLAARNPMYYEGTIYPRDDIMWNRDEF